MCLLKIGVLCFFKKKKNYKIIKLKINKKKFQIFFFFQKKKTKKSLKTLQNNERYVIKIILSWFTWDLIPIRIVFWCQRFWIYQLIFSKNCLLLDEKAIRNTSWRPFTIEFSSFFLFFHKKFKNDDNFIFHFYW